MHAGIRPAPDLFATWATCLKSQGDTQPAGQKFNYSRELGILARGPAERYPFLRFESKLEAVYYLVIAIIFHFLKFKKKFLIPTSKGLTRQDPELRLASPRDHCR